jgi:hypothetical protein
MSLLIIYIIILNCLNNKKHVYETEIRIISLDLKKKFCNPLNIYDNPIGIFRHTVSQSPCDRILK